MQIALRVVATAVLLLRQRHRILLTRLASAAPMPAGLAEPGSRSGLCWLLNSSKRFPCAEIPEIKYHSVHSTIHLESIAP
jgi:hypothetical protein